MNKYVLNPPFLSGWMTGFTNPSKDCVAIDHSPFTIARSDGCHSPVSKFIHRLFVKRTLQNLCGSAVGWNPWLTAEPQRTQSSRRELAMLRNGHSVSDDLYPMFVYTSCTAFWWKWLAEKTSTEKNGTTTYR